MRSEAEIRERIVPFFFKQWGHYGWWDQFPEETYRRIDAAGTTPTDMPIAVGKKRSGRLLDGCEWSQFPEVADVNR